MSYNPVTDFLALLRQSGSEVELARMPGLDFIIAGMARAGMITLWTSQSAPMVNQSSTVWLKPALPSWTAEGGIFLYDANVSAFVQATPDLWASLLTAPANYAFQSVQAPAGVIDPGTTLLAVRRSVLAPTVTTLQLPPLLSRLAGQVLNIVDWSDVLAEHAIQLTTPDGATIMKRALWTLYSSADQLSGVTLRPSADLNGWVIAP